MALKSFREFNKLVKKTADDNEVIYHGNFTVEYGGELARITAIDTGRATANWKATINQPDTTPKKIYDQSATANATKKRMKGDIVGLKKGNDTYISNGVQGEDEEGNLTGQGYIIKLNNGGSKQARYGMTEPIKAKAKRISRRALKK